MAFYDRFITQLAASACRRSSIIYYYVSRRLLLLAFDAFYISLYALIRRSLPFAAFISLAHFACMSIFSVGGCFIDIFALI